MPDRPAEPRSDSVEEKLRLLEQAHRSGNHDIAMSLAESIKDTLSFERQSHPGKEELALTADVFGRVDELPAAWQQWADGWTFYKTLAVSEPIGLARDRDVLELAIAFRADQLDDLNRELRVARVDASNGRLVEVPNQVHSIVRCDNQVRCQLVVFADVPAHGCTHYCILYGNRWAELPDYPTDLQVEGEEVALNIANEHYIAALSGQMGQLERLTYKREHGLELFAGGPGHGEPPGIDWAHDYVSGDGFHKVRTTNWSHCPNVEVTRGPLCVKVRRWGFPHSPLHPLFTPSRMHIDITYTFYAGLPYFLKQGRMDMVKDLDVNALRDDEWVFSGFSFTDPLWIDNQGLVHEGPPDTGQEEMHGIGYFNRDSRDAFIALWLDLDGDQFDDLHRKAAPNMYYRPHGHCWARYPVGGKQHFSSGTSLHQRNAYLVGPYYEPGGAAAIGKSRGDVQRGPVYADVDGVTAVQDTRQRLLNPLVAKPAPLPTSSAVDGNGTLARRGETAADAPLKRRIWEALQEVKDPQLYTVDTSVVDLGYVCDIRVRGDVVSVLVSMPHRGRPIYQFIGDPIREHLLKLDGIRDVIVAAAWNPPWSVARLTEAGERSLGLM